MTAQYILFVKDAASEKTLRRVPSATGSHAARDGVPGAGRLLGVLALALSRLGLALLAAVLVAFLAATLLVTAWAVIERERGLGDAPHAWVGIFMVTLASGSPWAVEHWFQSPPICAWPCSVCWAGSCMPF